MYTISIETKKNSTEPNRKEGKIMMKRIYIPIWKALKDARDMFGYPDSYGIMACYDIENMGFCKDEKTRWYHFTSVDGVPAYTLKH